MADQLDRTEPLLTESRYLGLQSALVEWSRNGVLEERVELPPRETLSLDEDRANELGEMDTIRAGDRIDYLSFQLLGDSRRWWILADLNPTILTDPLNPPVGEEIFVPYLDVVGAAE